MADPGLTEGPCGLLFDLRCADQEWLASLEDWQLDRSMDLARAAVKTLTAGQAGWCPVTVRPSPRPDCLDGWRLDEGLWWPNIAGGQWRNWLVGQQCCARREDIRVLLPGWIAEVVQVWCDGVVLDPSAYRVDNRTTLTRVDGGQWPLHQDITEHITEPGTLQVTYRPGLPSTPSQAWALGTLAVEFMKACTSGKCRLPSGVTQVVRQGVTMNVSGGAWPDGLTGIPSVDSYIQEVNPHRLKTRPGVWSPDMAQVTVVAGG